MSTDNSQTTQPDELVVALEKALSLDDIAEQKAADAKTAADASTQANNDSISAWTDVGAKLKKRAAASPVNAGPLGKVLASLPILLLAMLLAGCEPTPQQQTVAELRVIRQAIDAAICSQNLNADVERGELVKLNGQLEVMRGDLRKAGIAERLAKRAEMVQRQEILAHVDRGLEKITDQIKAQPGPTIKVQPTPPKPRPRNGCNISPTCYRVPVAEFDRAACRPCRRLAADDPCLQPVLFEPLRNIARAVARRLIILDKLRLGRRDRQPPETTVPTHF